MKAFKLDEHPKITSGFKVPEGYFEDFTEQMMTKLESEKNQTQGKVLPLYSKKKTWMFAAAAVLVLSLTIPVLNKISEKDELNQVEIENYLAYNGGITEENLVELLDKEDISNIKIDYKLEDESIEEALPADIENYIID